VALIVQALIATLIFATSLFLSVGGGASTVQDAYDILVNLTAVVYFVPFLYLFCALFRLDRDSPDARPSSGGGRLWSWGLAGVGFVATAVAVVLAFVPPKGTANPTNYVINLVVQTGAVMACGLLLWVWRRGRRPEARRT
jgi:amino acid transporter